MPRKLGRYELIAKIGSGGMAEVFLARMGGVEGFSRQLVVKRMRPELADRKEAVSMFLDEARLCAKLSHPNVVQVYDLGEADGTYYIAMEFVDGPHLGKLARHLVKTGHPLPLLMSAYIVNRVADGLHYAHVQRDPETGQPLGIVHRDISPHNLLVSRFGDVKVADFGVAKALGKASETKSGVVKGKIAYMSPEQVYGDELDGRSDVFALGIVLFEIATSRRLYKHKSELVSMQRITQEDAPAPSRFNEQIDGQLEHIILKALQRDRERRYASAQAMKEELDVWISERAAGHLKSELSQFMKEHASDLEMMREEVMNTGSIAHREQTDRQPSPPMSTSPVPSASDEGLAATAIEGPRPVTLGGGFPGGGLAGGGLASGTAGGPSEISVDIVSQLAEGTRTVPARKTDVHYLETLLQDPPATSEGDDDDDDDPDDGPGSAVKWGRRATDKGGTRGHSSTYSAGGDRAEPSTSGISLSTKAFGQLKTNLSPHRSRFIGRKDDLRKIHDLFEGGAQIVSVVGPAGTGKTRIALRYAERHLPDLSSAGGGAWFADITTAHDVAGIAAAVAGALNVPLTAVRSEEESIEIIARALAGRGKTLLILDNFEQVVDFGPTTVSRWAALAPQVRFLVTSRERLKLDGEMSYELEPLRLPSASTNAESSEAVQLFLERAKAVKPGYKLTPADTDAVAKIVEKLDGIPLAIELAAARMSVLQPQKILERLSRRFDLLKGGGRNLSPRQATLRGAVDWSWGLLSPVEQDALRQCAVFRGSFSLEAAEEVLDLSMHEGAPWPLDVVQALRDKSLLRAYDVTDVEGETRFRMYESVREYASEKLSDVDRASAEARHARYFLQVAEEWGRGATTHGGASCLTKLRLDMDNIFAVQERARGLAGGTRSSPPAWASPDMPLRVAVALEPLFAARGPFSAQIKLVDEALTGDGAVEASERDLSIRALLARGRARRRLGQIAESRHDYAEALKLAKAGASARMEGPVLRDLGILAADEGRLEDALRNCFDALEVHKRTHDRAEEGITLAHLAFFHDEQGRMEEAISYYDRALDVLREVGDQRVEGLALGNYALVHQERGDLQKASEQLEKAMTLLQDVGDRTFEGIFNGYRGGLAHEAGRLEEAIEHYKRSLTAMRETGNVRYEGMMLGCLSAVYACLGLVEEAEKALADADKRNREIGDPRHIELGKLLRGFYELALAKKARTAGNGDAARSLLDRVKKRVTVVTSEGEDGTPSAVDRSDDIRRALRLLQNDLAKMG